MKKPAKTKAKPAATGKATPISDGLSANLYRVVFDLSTDALLIIEDATGKITDANGAVETLLGYVREEIVGKSFPDVFPDDPSSPARPPAVYGPVISGEFRRKDGSVAVLDMTAAMIPWPTGTAVLMTLRDAADRIRAEKEKEALIRDLEEAIDRIKTLRGLLPICAHCKKIRDDQGYWAQVETYIEAHSLAEFSHGICPECARKYYPEMFDKEKTGE